MLGVREAVEPIQNVVQELEEAESPTSPVTYFVEFYVADQEEETSTDEHDTSMDTTGPVENHDPGPSQPPAASSSTPNSIDYPRVAAPQPPQPTPLPSNHRDRVENLSDFKSEAARLTTYQGWPLRNQTPADLANAGFVYTGRNDIVRCVFCSEYVGNWDPVS